MPELADLELLAAPGGADTTGTGVRTVIRLDGAPVGVLRESPGRGDSSPRECVLAELSNELSVSLAARRLPGGGASPLTERVTVVVCTRDRPELLDGCLAALGDQDHEHHDVLVVDNASRGDETRRVAEKWAARCVVESQPGLDRARNRGLDQAQSALIAFTDDDARPEPGWLGALVRPFASPDVQAVTGLVLPAELRVPAQTLFEDVYGGMGKGFHLRVHTEAFRRSSVRPERIGVGCNMAFRRSALIDIGGFDPALDVGTRTGGGGDLDVFQRLLESSGVIVYEPAAVVRHLHRSDVSALRRQLFDNGRAYGAMLTAAYLRGNGTHRRGVVARYARWLVRWHGVRLVGSLLGRERLPLDLVVAELAGAPLGPMLYLTERRAARRGEGA